MRRKPERAHHPYTGTAGHRVSYFVAEADECHQPIGPRLSGELGSLEHARDVLAWARRRCPRARLFAWRTILDVVA
jgi:hypothetical protein